MDWTGLDLPQQFTAESRPVKKVRVIKDITIHIVRNVGRDVFSRTTSSASSANIGRIALPYRCDIVESPIHSRFITISRRLL